LKQGNTFEQDSLNPAGLNEIDDFKIALELQKEEEKTQKLGLRRRAAGINRKYQDGLVIVASKNKKTDDGLDNSKSKRVLNKPSILSPEMVAFFDNQFTELPRPEVVKKLWEYIKIHNLQDPKDKRFILCDEKLRTLFNRPRVNCFKMAKYLSAHIHRKEDLSDSMSVKSSMPSTPLGKVLKNTVSSPKKQKMMSNEIVDDSDVEAEDLTEELLSAYQEEPLMNPLLLKVPGVTPDMSYTSVQAAISAYTQIKKLRHPKDNDLVIIRPNAPLSAIMSNHSGGTVHLLDLIQRVQFLFEHKNEK
jgi:chromatin remodeling complex protein RSC6